MVTVYIGMQWTFLIKVDDMASISGQLDQDLSPTNAQMGLEAQKWLKMAILGLKLAYSRVRTSKTWVESVNISRV